jgi:hypothetical protein
MALNRFDDDEQTPVDAAPAVLCDHCGRPLVPPAVLLADAPNGARLVLCEPCAMRAGYPAAPPGKERTK